MIVTEISENVTDALCPSVSAHYSDCMFNLPKHLLNFEETSHGRIKSYCILTALVCKFPQNYDHTLCICMCLGVVVAVYIYMQQQNVKSVTNTKPQWTCHCKIHVLPLTLNTPCHPPLTVRAPAKYPQRIIEFALLVSSVRSWTQFRHWGGIPLSANCPQIPLDLYALWLTTENFSFNCAIIVF